MIVLGEKGDGCNILHIIIGPETDNQFDFTGQSVMDISDYIKNMDHSLPCKLVINPCSSEEELINVISYQEGRRQADNMMKEIQKRLSGEGMGMNNQPERQKPSLTSNKNKSEQCPLCYSKNASKKDSNGIIQPCDACQRIEDGLKAKEIPEARTSASLEDLRREINEEHPEQKSSLQRYLHAEEELDEEELDDDMIEDEDDE